MLGRVGVYQNPNQSVTDKRASKLLNDETPIIKATASTFLVSLAHQIEMCVLSSTKP